MAQRDKTDAPIIIKKYANRRLYNTAKSSYVTLEDLSRMVRAGDDFKVFDAKTGEEITRSVLTQIIFEEEAKGQQMLPTNFLRQLIRLYGDALQGVVPGYLDASMETFSRNQERMRAAFGTSNALETFEAVARSNMEWFERAMKMFGPLAGPAVPRTSEGSGASGASEPAAPAEPRAVPPSGSGGVVQPIRAAASGLEQDLDALQQQLRDMQTQIEKLSHVRTGAKPAEVPRPKRGGPRKVQTADGGED